jgi:hypothetical protein
VALQTKAPFITPVAAMEGYEEIWKTANTVNHSVLPWKHFDDEGRPIPPPTRVAPPPAASGHIEGMKVAQEELMLVSGQYQAVMGAPSNETSGVAINARQRQGDNATYHFIDHLASLVRFVGRIVLDLIPVVYDTPRVLQALGEDGTHQKVAIDPSLPQAVQPLQDEDGETYDPEQVAAALNPAVGKYDVIADVGPSYGTQRQEAFNAYSQLVTHNPDAFHVLGDLWMRNADFPGADTAAKRLENLVPAQAKGGPDPQVIQMQQQFQQMAQQGQQQIEQLHAELQDAKRKLADKDADLDRQNYEAETRRLAAVGGIDPAALKPVIRQLVSEVLQTPIVPVMAQHAAAEQAMQPPEPPPQEGAPSGI